MTAPAALLISCPATRSSADPTDRATLEALLSQTLRG